MNLIKYRKKQEANMNLKQDEKLILNTLDANISWKHFLQCH